MSRDSSGNYTLPLANVVTGTTISSTWANTTLNDLKGEITNSLDRQGRGGMLSNWRGIDGSAAAPAYSFTSETGTGFYLAGANDVRMVMVASALQTWTPTAITIARPLTVTTNQTNTAGVTGTGNGTGGGGVFTGGATGNGVTGTGGSSSGAGGVFTGTGGGNGVTATGQGAGYGVLGTGGGTNATGVRGVGGATNGVGVSGQGTGTGTGVSGTGGASNGHGVTGQGTGTGFGMVGTGGAGSGSAGVGGVGVNGPGGLFTGASGWYGLAATGAAGAPGLQGTPGTLATAAVPQTAINVNAGFLAFTNNVNPNSDVSFKDTLTPTNTLKATATLKWNGSGGVTIDHGFNITSASVSGTTLTVTFAQDFADTTYTVTFGQNLFNAYAYQSKAVGSIQIIGWWISGARNWNFATDTGWEVSIHCTGKQ